MARIADPDLKTSLVSQTADYLLEHGYAGISLRPLADELQTSPRMLLFHFESKEHLLTEALEEVRSRQLALFGRYLAPRRGLPYTRVLSRAGSLFFGAQAQPYFRVFQQVSAVALLQTSPMQNLSERLTKEWLPMMTDGFLADGYSRLRAVSLATMTLATTRGLIMDLAATGERKRVLAGYRQMITLLNE